MRTEYHYRRGCLRTGNQHPAIATGERPGRKDTAFGGARGGTDVPEIVDWCMEKNINIDDLVAHELPFERIDRGFDPMLRGEPIRSVVVH
jgi:Zn-dependent alcohol dehydrogenase